MIKSITLNPRLLLARPSTFKLWNRLKVTTVTRIGMSKASASDPTDPLKLWNRLKVSTVTRIAMSKAAASDPTDPLKLWNRLKVSTITRIWISKASTPGELFTI